MAPVVVIYFLRHGQTQSYIALFAEIFYILNLVLKTICVNLMV